MGTIGLPEALSLLRQELAEAQDAGQGHQFRFEVVEAEIEFLMVVAAEGGAGAKVTFGVVLVGGGGKVSRSDTHRLRLKLNVKDAAAGDRNLEVRGRKTRSWDE